MYNATVIQYADGHPIREFPATVHDGRIVASALLPDTGLENTPMYEDYLQSHFLSRNTTFAIADTPPLSEQTPGTLNTPEQFTPEQPALEQSSEPVSQPVSSP